MLKYAIFGQNGKMGKTVTEASLNFNTKATLQSFDIKTANSLNFIIDFSSPEGSLNLAEKMQGFKGLIACGTTGFTEAEFAKLKGLSKQVKILYSANFSLGVFKFLKAVKLLAHEFEGFDVEILEKHHSLKKDAPSGTALAIGKVIAKERGQDFEKIKVTERNKLRKKEEIGFASIRQGAVSGFHEASFASSEERIWIGHEAFNKGIFASGAIEASIKACDVLKKKPNGFFSLEDII